jgi:hypothetical protein
MNCPNCNHLFVKGICPKCNFTDKRKVHTMLNPDKERRGKRTGWDMITIGKERKG